MPVVRCTKKGTAGKKWGKQGACYTDASAAQKAARQGSAIKASQRKQGAKN